MKTAVFVTVIDPEAEITEVYPPERQAEIERCSNSRVRMEKYTAWRLLEFALRTMRGTSMESLVFSKDQYGKWSTEECFFSISHSGGAVAVAVSDKPVGVDIEAIKRYREGLERMILTPTEAAVSETGGVDADEYIIKKWSEKESIFKTLDKKGFEPLKIETEEYPVVSRRLEMLGKSFVLAVCSEDIDETEYYLNTRI